MGTLPLKSGKAKVDLRLRYETADQDNARRHFRIEAKYRSDDPTGDRHDAKLHQHPQTNRLGHFQGARKIIQTQGSPHAKHDDLNERNDQNT